jgi:hypothetical protein
LKQPASRVSPPAAARRAVAALLLVCACAWAPARATIAPLLGLDELEREAEVIVLGTVRQAEPRMSGDGRIIVTRIKVEIERALKGGPRATIEFEIPGGTLGGRTLVAEGAPILAQGERVLLFLGRSGAGATVPLGVAGWNQGHLRVQRDPRTGRDIVTQPGGGTVYVDRQGRPVARDGRLAGPNVLEDVLRMVEGAIERGRAGGGGR